MSEQGLLLGKNLADNHLKYFSHFPQEIIFFMGMICIERQCLFSRKNKEISICCLLNL